MNTNFSADSDGYLKIWVNNELRCDYQGPILVDTKKQFLGPNHRRGIFVSYTKRWDSVQPDLEKPTMIAYYDEFYNDEQDKNVKVYAQRKTVHDQPNPPQGKYSVNHNRSEGYADYKIGAYYVSPDDLWIDTNDNEHCPYLYLLMMQNKDRNRKQQLRHKNISRASSSTLLPNRLLLALLWAFSMSWQAPIHLDTSFAIDSISLPAAKPLLISPKALVARAMVAGSIIAASLR